MTINYQFGDVGAHGATIRAQAASSEVKQAITRNVIVVDTFGAGAGSAACQEFITQWARDFQVIYEQANAHGQKVQTTGSSMASTDSAASSSWALRRMCHATMTADISRPHTRRSQLDVLHRCVTYLESIIR